MHPVGTMDIGISFGIKQIVELSEKKVAKLS